MQTLNRRAPANALLCCVGTEQGITGHPLRIYGHKRVVF